MPNATLQEMDINNIPTVSTAIYPTNDVARACYVRNPRLIRDELFREELTRLNADFTMPEVTNTLKTFSRSKNHGLGIHTRLLGIAWTGVCRFVVWLMTRFLRVGHFANIFKLAVIKPCIKKGKSPLSFAGYRQITMTGIVRKLFEPCISARVTRFMMRCSLLDWTHWFCSRAMYCLVGIANCQPTPSLLMSRVAIPTCSTTSSWSASAHIMALRDPS